MQSDFKAGAARDGIEDDIFVTQEYDEDGRIVRELKGNRVREISYNDDPNGNWVSRWAYYDLSREWIQQDRPDLLAWADAQRHKQVHCEA